MSQTLTQTDAALEESMFDLLKIYFRTQQVICMANDEGRGSTAIRMADMLRDSIMSGIEEKVWKLVCHGRGGSSEQINTRLSLMQEHLGAFKPLKASALFDPSRTKELARILLTMP